MLVDLDLDLKNVYHNLLMFSALSVARECDRSLLESTYIDYIIHWHHAKSHDIKNESEDWVHALSLDVSTLVSVLFHFFI